MTVFAVLLLFLGLLTLANLILTAAERRGAAGRSERDRNSSDHGEPTRPPAT